VIEAREHRVDGIEACREVGVHEEHLAAARDDDALADRGTLALVARAAEDVGTVAVTEALERDLDGVIGTAVVDHHQLRLGEARVFEQAIKGGTEPSLLIEGGDQDGDFRGKRRSGRREFERH
jgi:hypothetical protein